MELCSGCKKKEDEDKARKAREQASKRGSGAGEKRERCEGCA